MLFFLRVWFCIVGYCWVCLWLSGNPHHATMMQFGGHSSVGILGERLAKPTVRPRFSPCMDVFFLVSKPTIYFSGEEAVGGLDASQWEGPAPWAW